MVNSYTANIDREVSPNDRLSFALFLAAALHTAFYLASPSTMYPPNSLQNTGVTLAQHRIDVAQMILITLRRSIVESGSSAEKQLLASTADPSSVISQIGAAYPKPQRRKKS